MRGPHAWFCERADAGPDQPGVTLLDPQRGIGVGQGLAGYLVELAAGCA